MLAFSAFGPPSTLVASAMKRKAAILSIALIASMQCGGGGSPAPPSAPTPTPGLPQAGVCGTLGLSGSVAILNGTACPPDTSAVVLLNMRDRDGLAIGACSGTIIAPRAILTAAHCIADGTALVRVWLGSGAEIVARSFTPHPAYRSSASVEDVGIVTVDQDLGRTPIALLLSRDARVGESAVVAGWGRDQSSVPATLRAGATTLTAVGPALLETQYGASVSSVCSGDSGGPILISEAGTWSVAGVTSATSENVCNTGTNYYVNLRSSSISTFITQLVPDFSRR
jgi:secreted trypsin-like serine protease